MTASISCVVTKTLTQRNYTMTHETMTCSSLLEKATLQVKHEVLSKTVDRAAASTQCPEHFNTEK